MKSNADRCDCDVKEVAVSKIVDALRNAGQLYEVQGESRGEQRLPDTICDIADDSRAVRSGSMFIAIHGDVTDGHKWLRAAGEAGASVAIVEDAAAAAAARIPALVVRSTRISAAIAAAAFFNWPAKSLGLIAVTGTNGKTTSVNLLRHLLSSEGYPAASIGTLGVLVGSAGEELPGGNGLTTPGAVEIQRLLWVLHSRGIKWVALEASSHALYQHRLESTEFRAAVFTNLTRDHLDYHGSMAAYRAAKLKLLDLVTLDGTVCVNLDDPEWQTLETTRKRCDFGVSHSAQLRAVDVSYGVSGSRFVMLLNQGGETVEATVTLPLIGDFNVVNALGVAAAAVSVGLPLTDVAAKLSCVPQVPGRLERLLEAPLVLRDYAHTPDALDHTLKAVRPFTVHDDGESGRLIVVFGCGGDRDRGKRPLMGRIAESLADVIILTSDNPRTEDPERILDDIDSGMILGKRIRITDRRDAIAEALSLASERDVVILAGKGHETYQIRGTERFPFDEREIVSELAASMRKGRGRGRSS